MNTLVHSVGVARHRRLTLWAFIFAAVVSHSFSICLVAQTEAERGRALAQRIRTTRATATQNGAVNRRAATADSSSTQTFSGNETEDDETFAVGASGATVSLSWDMYEVPDRLEVIGSLSLPGIPLPSVEYFDTGEVQYQGGQTLYIPPGSSSFEVIMNRGGGTPGTAWTYTITVTQGNSTSLSGVDGNPNQIGYDPFDPLKGLVIDPVDPSTGAHDIRKTLLSLGSARPLTFEINYNSLLGFNGPLGTGWSHNHQVALQGLNNGGILLKWNNKRQNAFQPVNGQANTLLSKDQAALFYTLTRNADQSFTLRSKDQSTWVFDPVGRMTSQTNPVGQRIVYAYNGSGKVPVTIAEPVSGRSFSLTYDAQNKITQVADNTGRSVSFAYSTDLTDRLVGITTAEGSVSQTYAYTYDNNGRVLTGTTPEGVTVFQDSYDDQQRIASQTDANDNTTYFSYDETGQPGKIVTTVTDRLGKKSVYVSDANFHLVSRTDPLAHVTAYAYDPNGSRTGATDANAHTAQFAYDATENLVSSTDAANQVSKVAYDASNRPVTITNAGQQQETIVYDASNRPTATKDFQNNQTAFSYDGNSLLLSQTLPRGGKRQFAYAAGQPTQITDPDGNTSKVEYDAKGRAAAVTDAAGSRSTLGYDLNDHLTSRTDPLGHVTSDTYDSRGLRLTHTDPCGCTTKFSYDGNSNLLYQQDAAGNYTSYGYDAEDRMFGVKDANGNTTYFSRDAAGRLIAITDPLNNKVQFSYDAAGNRTGITDALGHLATTTFDARNLPLTVQDALKRQTAYTYDSMGRLASKTDPLQRTTAYAYDADSRLVGVTNPLGQTTAQSFDADGSLSALVDAKKDGTGLAYDLAGRLASLTTQSGSKTAYAYDPRGLLTKLTKPSTLQSTSTYDAAGRRLTLADGTGTTSYTYDANGRVLTTARNDGSKPITRAYDILGHLTSLSDTAEDVLSYAYDSVGNQTAITYATGLVVRYTYDADNRMSSVTDWNGRKTTYAYDANGRLATTTRADGSVETRTYDAAGQLTGLADAVNGQTIYQATRTFDAAGQVTGETTVPAAVPPPMELTIMTFDADNRLASFDGFATVFNADGNMTSGPLGVKTNRNLTYDSRNELVKAPKLGYLYDADSHRIASYTRAGAVSGYIYDPSVSLSRLAAKINPDGSVTRYIYGQGLISDDEGGSYRLYHFDARGSTVALTDAGGKSIGTASYGPFGELTARTGAAVDVPFLFNGRFGVVTDANGLYYMRARYYDPAIRRFINQDPTLGSPDDGGGLNRFAFANGNPISFIDPFGLSKDEIDDGFRFPDFYSININLEFPLLGAFGGTLGVTIDRYGNVYPSGGGGIGSPGVSAAVGYITQISTPSEKGLFDFLSGPAISGGGGYILGGTLIYSPKHDASTDSHAISFGFFTPQAGASGTYTPPSFVMNGHIPYYIYPIRLP